MQEKYAEVEVNHGLERGLCNFSTHMPRGRCLIDGECLRAWDDDFGGGS